MALLESLTVNLGSAVAKSLAKLWLKDYPVGAGVVEGVVDTIKKRFEDFGTRRGAEKLLEELQFHVAQRLESMLRVEFPDVPEYDVNAAVLTVGEVLNHFELTSELVRSNLDAATLYRTTSVLLQSRQAELGGDAARIADLLLRESCAYVVTLSSKLPDFEVAATAELLKRSHELLGELERVLDGVESIRRAVDGAASLIERNFETDYRRVLLQKVDRMELFGVRLAGGGARDWALSVAYVTLSSRTHDAKHSSDIDVCMAGRGALLVCGEAGSGKTTLLHWLAVRAAGRDFPRSLEAWNGLMPFYVRLRDYAATGRALPTPAHLLDSCTPNLADAMPKGWANKALQDGALVLVDGIDELPADRRDELVAWCAALKAEFPRCIFVLTSRPAALDVESGKGTIGEQLARLSFQQLQIEPMTPQHSAALVQQWHEAVGRDIASTEERLRLAAYSANLQRTLRDFPQVRSLAANPLLCAMICALNWDQKQHIPSDRMELYRLALQMLVHARDADRNLKGSALDGFSHEVKLSLLSSLAYWMLRNGYSEITLHECVARTKEALQRLASVKHEAVDVMQDLLERTGVLRQPSQGMVDFIHRTFLEYLAARAAVDMADIGVLVDKAREEGWRETVVFAAGHARGETRDRLIESLLKKPWIRSRRPLQVDVTAACCLETVSSGLDPRLLARLQERAEKLFPPTDFSMARMLAAAAKLAPHQLSGHESLGAHVVAACIRCASLIGGKDMLDVISGYASLDNLEVQIELLSAWSAFDEQEYLERVIARQPWREFSRAMKIEDVDIDTLRFLYFAAGDGPSFTSSEFSSRLRTFALKREMTVVARHTLDVQRLVKMRTLKRLDLVSCVPGFVEPLRVLPQLKALSLGCIPQHVNDLVAEAVKLPMLESLRFSGRAISGLGMVGSAECDLRPLLHAKRLAALSIQHMHAARLHLPFGPQLRELTIVEWSSAGDDASMLSGLGQCSNLEVLNLQLWRAPWLTGASLRRLAKLRELTLSFEHRESYELELPESIQSLDLTGFVRVRIRNAGALVGLSSLTLSRIDILDDALPLMHRQLKSLQIGKVPYCPGVAAAVEHARSAGATVGYDWI